jgi:hypothetical protein
MSIFNFSYINKAIGSEAFDVITYTFNFKCVPKDKVGQHDEKSFIKIYYITVSCSGLLRAMHLKNLTDDEIIKRLYWRACKAIKDDRLKEKQVLALNESEIHYYDPSIKFPNPESFDV